MPGCELAQIFMTLIALAPIVFLAFAVQASTGFGSVMISLAVGTLFWPVAEVLPIVVSISFLLSGYILYRHWKTVDIAILLRTILPLMGLGIVLGIFLAPSLSPGKMRLLLGIVVIGAALRGLVKMLSAQSENSPHSKLVSSVWIAGAGVVHGILATGGPPLVYALEGAKLGKASFRSTLAGVWFVLNLVHVVRFVRNGTIASNEFVTVIGLLPVVVLAIVVGEFCHTRVSERHFRLAVLALLCGAGLLLVAPMLVGT